MNLRIQAVSIDSTDPKVPADFWEKALGWRRTYEVADEIVLEPPAGSPADGVSPDLLFLKVPSGKSSRTGCTWICGRAIRPLKSSGWRPWVPPGFDVGQGARGDLGGHG